MCRVLGITNFDYSKHEGMVARFCELARTGIVMAEDPPGHMDGWGLAFYQKGKLVVHKSGKSPVALPLYDGMMHILNLKYVYCCIAPLTEINLLSALI